MPFVFLKEYHGRWFFYIPAWVQELRMLLWITGNHVVARQTCAYYINIIYSVCISFIILNVGVKARCFIWVWDFWITCGFTCYAFAIRSVLWTYVYRLHTYIIYCISWLGHLLGCMPLIRTVHRSKTRPICKFCSESWSTLAWNWDGWLLPK